MKRVFPLLALLSLAGCAASTDGASVALDAEEVETGPSLESAVETCGLPESALMDDGASLMLDGEGEDDDYGSTDKLSIDELACALIELEVAESTITKMSKTRALDGMQSEADDNFEYSWTYHPDNGLDVIVTTNES